QELALLLALGLTIALILGLGDHAWVRQLTLFAPGLMLVQTLPLLISDREAAAAVAVVNPMRRVSNVRRPVSRRLLIYTGAVLVLLTSVMDHVPAMGRVIPSIGNFLLIAYLYFLSK